ncbi:venom metalloproteinase BumaMPs1-like [Haemaphysalis longicornis]
MLATLALVSSIAFSFVRGGHVPNGAEVVFPQLYDVRDDLGTRVLRVNDKLTLNLKKSSVLHDEFMLRTYRQGVPQHTYFDLVALQEDLYHDEKHFASVFVSEHGGSVKVEGVVSPNLKIRPLEKMERSADGHMPHALEVISNDDLKQQTVYGENIQARNITVTERLTAAERYRTEKVYCEVRVVVDTKLRSGFNTTRDLIRYYMIVFNCIRLRYLTVTRPKISLKFRAIEVLNTYEENQFFEWISYRTSIDALKSLYKLVEYVRKRKKSYGKYDIVYVSTGLDMVAVEGHRQESALQGFAFVGSVCTDNRVGLGEDKAFSYISIRIMAHEMGHTLGCSHDGTGIDGTIRGYKADSYRCPWEDGYLMSYIEETHRSMKFSSCCDYSMSLVAWSTEINCLYERTSGSRLRNFTTGRLPGRYLSKNRQCRMTYPTLHETYFMPQYGIRYCIAQCFVPGWQFRASNSHWPMLLIDGSRCANNMICINGDCVWKKRRYEHKIVGK